MRMKHFIRKIRLILFIPIFILISGCKTDIYKNATSIGLIYSLQDGAYTVTGYEGDDEIIVIPSLYQYLPVVTIGKNAFSDTMVKRVKISQEIKIIEENAFSNSNIQEVVFEKNSKLKYIEKGAFSFSNISSIYIPKFVERISYGAFSETPITEIKVNPDNEYFTSIDGVLFNKEKTTLYKYPEKKSGLSYQIPESVLIIDRDAFANSQYLNEVIIPDNLHSIGPYGFENSFNLTSIRFSESSNLSSFGPFSFSNTKIESLYIPKNVIHLWIYTLDLLEFLKEINVHPDNPNYTSVNGVLYNKDQTQLIKYPENNQASSFVIPEIVVTIDAIALINLNNLREVTISKNINYIDSNTFLNNHALVNIEVNSDNPKYCSLDGVLYNKSLTKLIKYPENKSNTELIIPATVNYIDTNALSNLYNLKIIKILSEIPPELPTNFVLSSSIDIYVPASTIELYTNNYLWSVYKDQIFPIE